MSAIDTSAWGEFLVTELFPRIERGRGSGAGSFMDGNVPYIAASFANNGYVRDVEDAAGALTSDGNCIAMIVNGNGGIGRNTYQPEPFVASSDLQLGYHPKLNHWNGLFLVACLNKSIERYGYSFAWKRTGEAFAEETVFLPVTPAGDPDWDYMERIMRDQLTQQEAKLNSLVALNTAQPTQIDVSGWGEFEVKNLFDSITRAKRRTINSYAPGKVPYVTNSAFNNGITSHLEPKSDDDLEKGKRITVNTVDGSAFWQEDDFLANSSGNGLLMLRRGHLNKNQALFLCAALRASLEASFTVMLTTDVVKDLLIKLPVTTTGDPDWDYMERIMRDQLQQQESRLDVFAAIDAAPTIEGE